MNGCVQASAIGVSVDRGCGRPCNPAKHSSTTHPCPGQAQELLEAERERQAAATKKKRRLPRGTSEYQAAWIVDDEFSDASDDDAEDGDVEGMDEDGAPEGMPLGAGLERENSDDLGSMFGGAEGTEFGMDVRWSGGRGELLGTAKGPHAGPSQTLVRAVPPFPQRAHCCCCAHRFSAGSRLCTPCPSQYNDEEEEDVGERWRRQRDDREFPDEVRAPGLVLAAP